MSASVSLRVPEHEVDPDPVIEAYRRARDRTLFSEKLRKSLFGAALATTNCARWRPPAC
jgi:hypothetical protein